MNTGAAIADTLLRQVGALLSPVTSCWEDAFPPSGLPRLS